MMEFVIFTHPSFMQSQSMPRFALALSDSLIQSGHSVKRISPRAVFFQLFKNPSTRKWASYIDQYVIFPIEARRIVKAASKDTIFVFCDQALGPWVPLVSARPHVIHCHDLLALRSALDLIPENPTSRTGKIYQKYIRSGFQKGKRFIAISSKTKADLIEFGDVPAENISVVLNELNFPYSPFSKEQIDSVWQRHKLPPAEEGLILHIGGGQWYKNRLGVVGVYKEYVKRTPHPLPLWLVGPKPTGPLADLIASIPPAGKVIHLQGVDNEVVQALYSKASVFLFPSLAEGFGWPIVEAQACGCPVITTGEPPMNEVGGEHTTYIPRLNDDFENWVQVGATELIRLLDLPVDQRSALIDRSKAWARRFAPGTAFKAYLEIYEQTLKDFQTQNR